MARILIVDDSAYTRALLRRVLERAGHEIVGEAADGNAALEEFARVAPDLAIVDVVMPGPTASKSSAACVASCPQHGCSSIPPMPRGEGARGPRRRRERILVKSPDPQRLLDAVER